MPYKLCNITLGTSAVSPLFNINTQLDITGMIHINGWGFLLLFKNHHCLGRVDPYGSVQIPWMGNVGVMGDIEGTAPLFKYPSSVCYEENTRSCFLIEAGGSKIRQIDLQSLYCRNVALPNNFWDYFVKTPSILKTDTSCDVDNHGNLYWTVKDLHRCFMKSRSNNVIHNYIGTGRSGFTVSSSIKDCLMSKPSCVKYCEKSIYLSDTGNYCIRETNGEGDQIDTINLMWGHPANDHILSHPTQIKYMNGIMYVLDGENIKYFVIKDKSNGIVYSSPNIISFDIESKKNLYVLEKT
jgi:hypothetical protein